MKCVVLQGDGMGDEPIADLGGKTPLEAARTPNLDRMASRGILGLTRTIPQGMTPGSETGSLAVLGYDPARYPVGCAPFEAASLAVSLGPEDVAFRLNFVTIETGDDGAEVMRDYAGGHPSVAEGEAMLAELARTLSGDGIELHPGSGYRHLMVWRRGEAAVHTVAPHTLIDRPVAPALPSGPGADRLRDLMRRARALLGDTQRLMDARSRGERVPTDVWPWGQGRRPALPRLRERFGMDGSVVAAVDLVRGLGLLAGLHVMDVPGATGGLDSDLGAKVTCGLRALAERDFLLLHVGAPDESGHMGDAKRKVEAIERFDEQVVGPVLDGLRALGGEWRVLVTSDHATPCAQRTHTADPVPFVVYVNRDDDRARTQKRAYHERDARELGIFIPEGHRLLERLLRA